VSERLAKVPTSPSAILAIALNTFREAVRDRVLYLILAFALILIGASRLLSLMTVGSEEKIIKDLGLSAISIFGLLTSVFVGVSLVFKEIERRTVLTLLATPVRRWQFILGKYAGILLVLAVNTLVMSSMLAALLLGRGASPVALVPAVLLIFVELAVVTAFAILFSSFTNPILAALGTVAIYVSGHLSWSLELLKARVGGASLLCDAVHAVLPNLDRLDVKAQVVHGAAVSGGYLATAVLYGTLYTLVVMLVACAVFEKRDFA
jgi:ABC-type transport system involved in multi-copper enzyme maturation permease subunit